MSGLRASGSDHEENVNLLTKPRRMAYGRPHGIAGGGSRDPARLINDNDTGVALFVHRPLGAIEASGFRVGVESFAGLTLEGAGCAVHGFYLGYAARHGDGVGRCGRGLKVGLDAAGLLDSRVELVGRQALGCGNRFGRTAAVFHAGHRDDVFRGGSAEKDQEGDGSYVHVRLIFIQRPYSRGLMF